MNDAQLLLLAGTVIALLATGCELAARKGLIPIWLSRKLLHITAIGLCGGIVLLLESIELLRWIVLAATVLLFVLVSQGTFFREANGRRSWGIALFPLPYLALLWLHSDIRGLIALPMLSLAFCDAAAAIAGTLVGKRAFNWTGDRKTVEGSIAFAAVALIIFAWPFFAKVQGLDNLYRNYLYLLCLPVLSLISTLSEALGSGGYDNIWVPLTVWAGLLCFTGFQPNEINVFALIYTIPVYTWLMMKLKWLKASGIAASLILGSIVLLSLGSEALILPLFFMFSSTMLGKLRKRQNPLEAKSGKARDAAQVMANGGIFLLLCCICRFWPQPALFVTLASSMAICTADTWASEVGAWKRGRTIDICSFKPVKSGLSGGISVSGTLAGLLGSLAMAVLAAYCFDSLNSLESVCIIALSGFCGMLLDSVLGSRLQLRFSNGAGEHSDVALPGFSHSRGISWLSNDMVNLLSNLLVCLALLAWLSL